MLFYFLLRIIGAVFFFLCLSEYHDDHQGNIKKTKWTYNGERSEPQARREKRILLLIKKLDAKTLEIWCFFT